MWKKTLLKLQMINREIGFEDINIGNPIANEIASEIDGCFFTTSLKCLVNFS